MAKQYMLPLLHRLANLRTEVATGRTRRNYGVGRELTGEELSRRKTEIARLERWTGRAKKTSVRRTPARHCACPALRLLGTPRLPTQLGDSSSAIKKLRGLGGTCQAQSRNTMQKSFMPCKNRVKSSRPYVQVWPGRMRGQPRKTGPVKKEWQIGRDNDSRSRRPRTAAPGLARGRMVRPEGLRCSRAQTGS